MSDVVLGVQIPKLDQILDRLAALDVKITSLSLKASQNQGVLVTLQDDLAQLGATITEEFDEIAAKVDALQQLVADNQAAADALAALQADVAAAQETIGGFNDAVEGLSTAGDAPVDPPVEP